jgi:hypothetical protein
VGMYCLVGSDCDDEHEGGVLPQGSCVGWPAGESVCCFGCPALSSGDSMLWCCSTTTVTDVEYMFVWEQVFPAKKNRPAGL